jgi:chemotaxis protein MotB
MRLAYFYLVILSFALFSCVSTSTFKAMQQQAHEYDSLYAWSQHTLKTCQDANSDLSKQKTSLQTQANDMSLQLNAANENNTQLRKQLQDLSAISSMQAESIKKSLDNIGAKDTYLREVQSAVSSRDSQNLAVVMDLKATLGGFGDQDVSIKLEKGVVYVDLSDRVLFNGDSNSVTLSSKAKSVLGRMARVLNDQPDIAIMVEGHTDSISYHMDSISYHTDSISYHTDSISNPQDSLPDSWDISVKRATAVVRVLQKQYNISPLRMTAAGRGEYSTVNSNDTPEGRAANRRTRIVILPRVVAPAPSPAPTAAPAPPPPAPTTAPITPQTSAAPVTIPAEIIT